MLEGTSKTKTNFFFYLPFVIILMTGFFLLTVFKPTDSNEKFSSQIEGFNEELNLLKQRLDEIEATVANISTFIDDLNYSSKINALEHEMMETHILSLAEINEMKEDLEDIRNELSTLSGDPYPPEIQDKEETFSFESSVESVVSIQVACFNEGVAYVSKGSGFIYHEHGYILTNYHVVEHEAWGLEVVFNDGTIVEGDLVAYDADYDIALLKVKPHKTLTPVPLGNSSTVAVGETIFVIGNPFGYGGTLTTGVISQTQRTLSIEERYLIPGIIQFDATTNQGNSGSPLYNMRGEVIGLITAGINQMYGEGDNFAIPSNILEYVVPVLMEKGMFKHSYIGILMKPISLKIKESMYLNSTNGVLIVELIDGSPAEAAGLRGGSEPIRYILESTRIGGDIILKIDNVPINDMEGLVAFIDEHRSPGDEIIIQILRNGKKRIITLTLGERP
jgi:S1-C subfamily serine protease